MDAGERAVPSPLALESSLKSQCLLSGRHKGMSSHSCQASPASCGAQQECHSSRRHARGPGKGSSSSRCGAAGRPVSAVRQNGLRRSTQGTAAPCSLRHSCNRGCGEFSVPDRLMALETCSHGKGAESEMTAAVLSGPHMSRACMAAASGR